VADPGTEVFEGQTGVIFLAGVTVQLAMHVLQVMTVQLAIH
jgi:hypothetical protein